MVTESTNHPVSLAWTPRMRAEEGGDGKWKGLGMEKRRLGSELSPLRSCQVEVWGGAWRPGARD